MEVLRLVVYRKWFDLIERGIKKVEYRDIKPYWTKRFIGRQYDVVEFVNGYGSTRPRVFVELLSINENKETGKYELNLGSLMEGSRFV